MLSRRHVLHGAALLGLGGCGLDLQLASTASYDDVLTAIDRTDFEIGTGSNHAPMAADALVAGGRAERVADWVERYANRLQRVMTTGVAIAPAERAGALGLYERRFDWVATFVAELETRSASEVFAQAWALLGQGYFAAGVAWVLARGARVPGTDSTEHPGATARIGPRLGLLGSSLRRPPRYRGSECSHWARRGQRPPCSAVGTRHRAKARWAHR